MSYLPDLGIVTPPPRTVDRSGDWSDFVKRYMADHPQFRDNLRRWIIATNGDQATQDATLADHETRIDTLEGGSSGGGLTLAKVSLRA